jgi:N-acylneuraminate cytidylyltransferase
MDVLAVVPAAAGPQPSARSLIDRAVTRLQAARPVSRVIVAGDAPWLADLALPDGVGRTDAAAPGATDIRPTALAAALAHAANADGFAPALAVVLDPACPFLETGAIEAAIRHLLGCGADTLITVHAPGGPVWRTAADGSPAPVVVAAGETTLVENGALVAVRTGVFLAAETLPAGRVVLYPVPTLAGLRLAEADSAAWPAAEALADVVATAMRRAEGQRLLSGVGLVVFDFDGVMTDNRVVVFEDGREAVLCNRSDGLGLERLKAAGVPLAVISKEKNPVVGARCQKLRIPCHQGIDDKLAVLVRLAADLGVELARAAYVGNDINDLACLTAVGVPVAPADAYPEVLAVARIVTEAAGGFGAVREVADMLLAGRASG